MWNLYCTEDDCWPPECWMKKKINLSAIICMDMFTDHIHLCQGHTNLWCFIFLCLDLKQCTNKGNYAYWLKSAIFSCHQKMNQTHDFWVIANHFIDLMSVAPSNFGKLLEVKLHNDRISMVDIEKCELDIIYRSSGEKVQNKSAKLLTMTIHVGRHLPGQTQKDLFWTNSNARTSCFYTRQF